MPHGEGSSATCTPESHIDGLVESLCHLAISYNTTGQQHSIDACYCLGALRCAAYLLQPQPLLPESIQLLLGFADLLLPQPLSLVFFRVSLFVARRLGRLPAPL